MALLGAGVLEAALGEPDVQTNKLMDHQCRLRLQTKAQRQGLMEQKQ